MGVINSGEINCERCKHEGTAKCEDCSISDDGRCCTCHLTPPCSYCIDIKFEEKEEKKGLSNYLFFDTETTGLPRNYKAPLTDSDNWPRLVQLAYLHYSSDGKLLYKNQMIIKPEGFIIPKVTSDIHGVTTEMAIKKGVSLSDSLFKFKGFLDNSQYLIGHNVDFDANIVGAEFVRKQIPFCKVKAKRVCTMVNSVKFCKIPGRFGNYKWPKLVELHTKLFGKEFEGQHDAMADVEATAKCFWKLVELGEIKINRGQS